MSRTRKASPDSGGADTERVQYRNELRRAFALHQQGDIDAAEPLYRRIIARYPTQFDALNLLGIIQAGRGHSAEALDLLSRAIVIHSQQPETHTAYGDALVHEERLAEALASYNRALQLRPDYPEAIFRRASVLKRMLRFDEALAACDRVIELQPGHAEAHHNRGNILYTLRRHEQAVEAYGEAYRLDPGIPWLPGALLHSRMQTCDWKGWEELMVAVRHGLEADRPVLTPFASLALPISALEQRRCAETLVRDRFAGVEAVPLEHAPSPDGRIRIAYISADFHDHPSGHLMAGLFERHDRARFEVTAFSLGPPVRDRMRYRLEQAFDRFIDVHNHSDDEVVLLARKHGIDIAIDANGYTMNARPGIFAHRVASVQVSYLAYPGTMGAGFIDYLIADPVLIPEEYKQHCTERIIRLPGSYQVNDNTRKATDEAPSRSDCGLPDEAFVFCCFNNNYKITPDQFDIWMRLLRSVDHGVLWLLGDNLAAIRNLRREAEARDVHADRLVFAERVPAEDHLARHRLADLFLDTFHYNAHTTASDALWTGLPLVTRCGETFASRVAASLLSAVGLPELITHTREEYEKLVLELARDPDRLGNLRKRLIACRDTCALFDTERTTRQIEAAYEAIWQRYGDGLPPDHIDIHH